MELATGMADAELKVALHRAALGYTAYAEGSPAVDPANPYLVIVHNDPSAATASVGTPPRQ
jgi:hypothetical protein